MQVSTFLKPWVKTLDSIFTIFQVNIHRETLQSAARWVLQHASKPALDEQKTICHFVNADCLNKAYKNQNYLHILNKADKVFADGSGIQLACKIKGIRPPENVNGTDLFPALCHLAEQHSHQALKIYLLGARHGVAEQMQAKMQTLFPKVQFVGAHHGYFDKNNCEEVIAEINQSKANLLLVGLGAPTQEYWLEQYRNDLDANVCMGVGGLFDYYSGNIPRAPLWLRKIGCEWVWRLLQEPQRLAKRYLLGNFVFVYRTIREHSLNKSYTATSLNPVFHSTVPLKKSLLRHKQLKLLAKFRIFSRHCKQSCQRLLKRSIDVMASSLALLLLSPLLLLTMLLIFIESPGNVFFSQSRIGKNGQPFKLWKLRSMRHDAEAVLKDIEENNEMTGGVLFKMKQDPRITLVGKFIRKYSIDELPQLWNVLNGSMSLVGPRPALPSEVARYQIKDRQRLLVKPGITCIWQVSGRSDIPFEQQVELDQLYISKRSLLTDIKLLLATIPAVLTARGAY